MDKWVKNVIGLFPVLCLVLILAFVTWLVAADKDMSIIEKSLAILGVVVTGKTAAGLLPDNEGGDDGGQ